MQEKAPTDQTQPLGAILKDIMLGQPGQHLVNSLPGMSPLSLARDSISTSPIRDHFVTKIIFFAYFVSIVSTLRFNKIK